MLCDVCMLDKGLPSEMTGVRRNAGWLYRCSNPECDRTWDEFIGYGHRLRPRTDTQTRKVTCNSSHGSAMFIEAVLEDEQTLNYVCPKCGTSRRVRSDEPLPPL